MDILGALPKTSQDNQYVLILTDWYLNLRRVILTSKKNATHISNLFLNHCENQFKNPAYVLTENGPDFVSNLFSSVCVFLRARQLMTMAYHLGTYGQAEQFDRTKIAGPRQELLNQQWSQPFSLQPFAYMCNTQVSCTTKFLLYSLVVWR